VRESLTALLVALPFGAGLATGATPEEPAPLFRFEDPAIVESSGLALADGLVVTANDSGDEARVFVVDPASGRTVGTTRWEGGAEDVEALAPAGDSEVWVGDIGDNARARESVSVVRVPVGEGERSVAGARVGLTYPDGPQDAEALLVHPEDGRLVVVTKAILGGEVYVAPDDPTPGRVHRLRPRGPVMGVVTDGAFLPDGDHLVLRDYTRAVVYSWPGLEAVAEVGLPEQRQGETLAVTEDETLLVGTEGLRSPVHEVALPALDEEATAEQPSAGPRTQSREGRELPSDPSPERDPVPWLTGFGFFLVALIVLGFSLRPPKGQRNHPR
jgi:hypothetical protein